MDVDWFTSLNVGDLSAPAALVLSYFLVMRGNLIPRSSVEREQKAYDARLAEKDALVKDWRDAYHTSEQARQVLATQVTELLALAQTTDHFIKSLSQVMHQKEDAS